VGFVVLVGKPPILRVFGICVYEIFTNTGQVPQLEKIVAVIRSREISLCMFLQAQSQIKAIYKDHAETILGNMDSVIFLGGANTAPSKSFRKFWVRLLYQCRQRAKREGNRLASGRTNSG